MSDGLGVVSRPKRRHLNLIDCDVFNRFQFFDITDVRTTMIQCFQTCSAVLIDVISAGLVDCPAGRLPSACNLRTCLHRPSSLLWLDRHIWQRIRVFQSDIYISFPIYTLFYLFLFRFFHILQIRPPISTFI